MQQGVIIDLSRMEYLRAGEAQQAVRNLRLLGVLPDTLIIVEHPPVFTVGRKGGFEHLKVDLKVLAENGVGVHEADRGGSVTFHGFGQVVAYPVMHVGSFNGDLPAYLRMLEETVIRALGDYGIAAGRFPPHTGVWVGKEKIAAIGVACRGAVTTHGFALNVLTDLRYFSMINPCGITEYGVTSMAALLPEPPALNMVKQSVAAAFSEVFDICLHPARAETAGVIPAALRA